MLVFLVGFMGCGKSSIGAALAKQLNCTFIDTDVLVEQQSGMSIANLFETHGEHFFRELEYNTLKNILNKQDCIVATGGGTPCFYDSAELMKNSGLCVYLRTDVSILYDRIKGDSMRPLLSADYAHFQRLYALREPCYNKFSKTLSTNNLTIVESVLQLKKMIFDESI
ncbi:MAG: shikimate kinase [Bacteroidetes bacterium]|nr:shikimate kinase [Bacteroidota bacterium]